MWDLNIYLVIRKTYDYKFCVENSTLRLGICIYTSRYYFRKFTLAYSNRYVYARVKNHSYSDIAMLILLYHDICTRMIKVISETYRNHLILCSQYTITEEKAELTIFITLFKRVYSLLVYSMI